jgi:hypothetical protein
MDAVPPRVSVEGGALVSEIEVVLLLLLAEVPEVTAPHPERLNTETRNIVSARKVALRTLRAKCTEVSLVEIVVAAHKAVPLLRQLY